MPAKGIPQEDRLYFESEVKSDTYVSKTSYIKPNGKVQYNYVRSTEWGRITRRKATLPNKLSQSKREAKRKGLDFDIDLPYLKSLWTLQDGKCKYSGIPLGLIGDGYTSVSVDRIDNSKGYTKDNVQLLIWRVNEMKRDMHESDFLNLCKLIGQSATTISSESTLETIADGSAWQPNSRVSTVDDIVYSTSGEVAVRKRTYK